MPLARYQISVADVEDAIQTAVGGNALTQVLEGEARYDLVLRYPPQYRDTKEAIESIRLQSPTGPRVSLAQLSKIQEVDGASEIYREGNRRYVAVKYSVRGRDLGSTVEEAIQKVNAQVKLPQGYRIDWEGEYASQKRASARLLIVLPINFVIMMTMLVATLGLLPAALSHAIGSDSQRPFAIVIVGGLIAALVMSVFLLPTVYVWIAGDHDVLPSATGSFEEGEHID
jgi:Cu/Ag efflux pump CusA